VPRRLWALAVQLYGVRSRRNWGHGDFSDLAVLLDLAADFGAAGIALNPLHVLFDDRAKEASPYRRTAGFFLTSALHRRRGGTRQCSRPWRCELEQEVEVLRGRESSTMQSVARAKMRALQLATRPSSDTGRATRRLRELPARWRFGADPIACFEFLRRRFGTPVVGMARPVANPTDTMLDDLRNANSERIAFFEFVQWLADEQLQIVVDAPTTCDCRLGFTWMWRRSQAGWI